MAEPWLRSNRRVAYFGAIPPIAVTLIGVALAAGWIGNSLPAVFRGIGACLALPASGFLTLWLYFGYRPRLAYRDGSVLVYLRPLRPICVPLSAVECFFLGQGPDKLAERAGKTLETTNVVMRLTERAIEWHRVDVHPVLGHWCDGYVTIHGGWCEPLSVDLVHRLNQRLREAKRLEGKK